MKLYLKPFLGIVALAFGMPVLLAADVTATYSLYPTNSHVPMDYSGSNLFAASSSNAVMVALNAQALLLKEIVQEHLARAADLRQKNQSEKAKWETELVNELQERSSRVQKSIDQLSQPGTPVNDLTARGGVDEQLVFVSTVDARLEQLHEELAVAIRDTRVLSMQIGTNKTPEDIGTLSLVLGDSQRFVKELQREQLDLELRKLEFRAIRKAIQK